MAVAEGAGYYTDTVGPLLKSLQDVFNVHFARAGQFDHFGPGRVSETESPGRVGGHIGAVDTSEDSNLRIETIIRHIGWNLREAVVGLLSGTVAPQAIRLPAIGLMLSDL
jgi:hypothetical protein